jgi:hypothetical protein
MASRNGRGNRNSDNLQIVDQQQQQQQEHQQEQQQQRQDGEGEEAARTIEKGDAETEREED